MKTTKPSGRCGWTLSLLFGVAGCQVGPGEARVRDPERPPHVVLILADDLGYGDLKCFDPDARIETPHLERLAAAGMRCTDAHAPGAFCIPSRYGLLTGRYPVGVKFAVRKRAAIAADQPTLATVLRGAGYSTAMVGKWHLGFEGGPDHDFAQPLRGGPVDRGFDSFFGIPASLDIPPYYYIRDRHAVEPPTGTVAASATPGWTRIQGAFWRAGGKAPGFRHQDVLPRCTAEAVDVIRRCGGGAQPFFLYLALPAPHTPWLPDPEFAGRSQAGMYGDFVCQVDAAVGTVLQALEDAGCADRTLVLFSSDNGPVWYPGDVERFGHRSTGPFRGMKSDSFEGGHRMPFIARWPGVVPAGSSCDAMFCFTDLLATLAEVAGVAPPPRPYPGDSVSILPLLRGQQRPVRDTMLLRIPGSVVRHRGWKLIRHLGSGGFSKPRRIEVTPGGPAGQLYDLVADPGETRNLWLARPEIVRRLEAIALSERAGR